MPERLPPLLSAKKTNYFQRLRSMIGSARLTRFLIAVFAIGTITDVLRRASPGPAAAIAGTG